MNGRELPKKLGLIGSGFGAVMFFVFGLLQGALVGGTAGVRAGAYLFAEGDAAARALAGAGMVLGAALAAVIFVTGGFATGRVVGYLLGAAHGKDERAPSAAHN